METGSGEKLSLKIPRFSGEKREKWKEWMYQFHSVLESSDLLDALFEPNPAAEAAVTTAITTKATDTTAGEVPGDAEAKKGSTAGGVEGEESKDLLQAFCHVYYRQGREHCSTICGGRGAC